MRLLCTAAALLLAGCATVGTSSQNERQWRCQSEALGVDTAFATGALADCTVDDEGNVAITIEPEDQPINCSPWYAFRLTPRAATTANVTLRYTDCGHRYVPKISANGQDWRTLDNVETSGNGDARMAHFRVPMGNSSVFVSAQEMLPPATTDLWMHSLVERLGGQRETIGTSIEGRPIDLFAFGAGSDAPTVLLLGRQHPPEVSGHLAMMHFAELLASRHSQAVAFRKKYRIVIVPMLNPDGVIAGHWRHNQGGVDLNRDWGPFTQPETQAIDRWLDSVRPDLTLMIDFHSTRRDVFYTLPDRLETDPPGFTADWLNHLQERMRNYRVRRDPNHDERPVSKGHIYDRFKIPTVTYEMGDETDRALVRHIAQQAALSMIETLPMR